MFHKKYITVVDSCAFPDYEFNRIRKDKIELHENRYMRLAVMTVFPFFYAKGILKRTANSLRRLNDKHVNDIIFWEKLIILCTLNIMAHARRTIMVCRKYILSYITVSASPSRHSVKRFDLLSGGFLMRAKRRTPFASLPAAVSSDYRTHRSPLISLITRSLNARCLSPGGILFARSERFSGRPFRETTVRADFLPSNGGGIAGRKRTRISHSNCRPLAPYPFARTTRLYLLYRVRHRRRTYAGLSAF